MRIAFHVILFAHSALALWPIPVSYEHGDTVLFVQKDIPFNWYEVGARNVGSIVDQHPDQFLFASHSDSTLDVQDNPRLKRRNTEPSAGDEGYESTASGVSGDDIIDYAIRSSWKTIFKQNLYPWKFHPRDWEEPLPTNSATSVSEVNIRLLANDPPDVGKSRAGEVDESYSLELSVDGKATITANSSVGIARGLNSFTQLFYAHSDGKHVYTPYAPVTIRDAPQFQHRGINLDVSRNYFSISDIKRQIDAIAYNKMNRFHLHVTDSQSWPLEIPTLPELSAKGAYRPDLVYTAKDFADIQHYAAIQGVEMVTEIDMPGHTSVIHYSFPDLIAAFNMQPDWDTYAAEPPSGTLKLNSTAVYDFLETLFNDLLPRVSPYSSYFHTGGDEVNKNAYNLDDTVKSNDYAILQPLMQKFVDRNHDQVRAAGLIPVVWEEMLLEWNLTLGDDVIVQSWRSDEAVAEIVSKGHKALVGNYNYWYLDCGKGQWLNFDLSVSADYWPYDDYCAPFHNWRLIYSYDPYAGVPEDKRHLVIGGEAHMWAEQTDPINVDRMIWPRGSAVAEILWSGAKDAEGGNRSQIDAAPRLSEMRERLVMKGIGAEPIQMPYCTMEGTVCQLGYTGEA
ncbi:glycoside hydrolase superfamily [Paraphoma chrysanthemicola]|uniref:Beta-hexosaminidase n=1 Tax=Paraphoma chrysanthemicola TaxID=798071 RepID=A0A8K0VUI2_9PLEO|nr:glycoside hydrolase superfamily [Paraphoma chrysanthemicola]